jgi:hypothetical protein
MTSLAITDLRLRHQQLTKTRFQHAGDLVKWFGAVQAQDYLAALWALGLRTQNATEAVIEQALEDRSIIRTWPMRGTLHFVAAEDARWLVKLLAERTVRSNAQRYIREFELDEAAMMQAAKVVSQALAGGKQLMRTEIYAALERAGIATTQQRGLHILSRLAQEGLICIGPRAGKQPAFALLDEWLPPVPARTREEALAEVARRYFTSHGPATLPDFIWWTGLSSTDAKLALELAKAQLTSETLAGQTFWFAPTPAPRKPSAPTAQLLPVYDEYTVAYKDRSAFLTSGYAKQAGNGIFNPVVILDGQVAGTWKRTLKRTAVNLSITAFRPLSKAETLAVAAAAQRYGKFLNTEVELEG